MTLLVFLFAGTLHASASSGTPPPQTDHYSTTKIISLANGPIAEQLGLKAGDVIESINGEEVSDPRQALAKLDKPGPYLIHIKRAGQEETLEYEVSE